MRRLSMMIIVLLIFFAGFASAAADVGYGSGTLTACYIGSTMYFSFTATGPEVGQPVSDYFYVEALTSTSSFSSGTFPINYEGTTTGSGTIDFTGGVQFARLDLNFNGNHVLAVVSVPPCRPNYGFFPECPNPLPNLSAVAVTIRQPAFGSPGGTQAQTFGAGIFLHDGSNPGTNYTVIKTALYNGKLWYGLYLGGCTPIWIPSDAPGVTLLAPIPPDGLAQS